MASKGVTAKLGRTSLVSSGEQFQPLHRDGSPTCQADTNTLRAQGSRRLYIERRRRLRILYDPALTAHVSVATRYRLDFSVQLKVSDFARV